MILIIDYGMGNLRSVEKAFHKLGFSAKVSSQKAELEKAKGIVLPGVGAFGDCIRNLKELGLIERIREFIKAGRPYLGICLGYQILFDESEEFGKSKGLGIFAGRVKKFSDQMPDPSASRGAFLKVPHMGWNQIEKKKEHPVLEGIESGSSFYFVHSYYPVPEDQSLITTETEYGIKFASSIGKGKLFACQFHPEKSQANGLALLKNFGKMVEDK
jgi:glutamine amidotransferase